jgi:hypothetical protein
MTLKPRCECSTCDACPNPPDRSGTCVNCFDGQPEFGDPAGSHEPLATYRDRLIDWSRVCHICGVDDVDTTKARLGDVAGQVTAIADRIVNVCGVGKCDA